LVPLHQKSVAEKSIIELDGSFCAIAVSGNLIGAGPSASTATQEMILRDSQDGISFFELHQLLRHIEPKDKNQQVSSNTSRSTSDVDEYHLVASSGPVMYYHLEHSVLLDALSKDPSLTIALLSAMSYVAGDNYR
jgi:hypothetical protein